MFIKWYDLIIAIFPTSTILIADKETEAERERDGGRERQTGTETCRDRDASVQISSYEEFLGWPCE